MSNHTITLGNKDQVFVYSTKEQILLQLRRQVPTEENILSPSFKVAVELTSLEALLLASHLLAIVSPRISSLSRSLTKEE